ncbi:MAG: type IV secretory system conjugative DNA transfer family protein [Magnetococcales bacterium]|nr:type IV secretory system conjugative DNA transfer family protein [Magnetococcales bacterium]
MDAPWISELLRVSAGFAFWWLALALLLPVFGLKIPSFWPLFRGIGKVLYKISWLLGKAFILIIQPPQKKPAKLLSRFEQWLTFHRGSEGFIIDGVGKRLSRTATEKHVLISGSSGTGKSASFFLPQLLNISDKMSWVVFDPKDEMIEGVSGFLLSRKITVLRLHSRDPSVSIRFNPLARAIKKGDMAIRKMANILCDSNNKGDTFWEDGAKSLIFLLASALKYQPARYHTLPVLRQLINSAGNRDAISSLIYQTGDANLISELEGLFTGMDPKTVAGWISNAKVATEFCASNDICRIISDDTLDISSFRHQPPQCLFLNISHRDQEVWRPVLTLLLQEFIDDLTADPSIESDSSLNTVMLLLDELGLFKGLKTLPQEIAIARAYRISFAMAVQSKAQLTASFGREGADIIQENVDTELIFGGGKQVAELRALSDRLGPTETKKNGKTLSKPLLSVSDLRQTPRHHVTVIHGDKAPFIQKLSYYKNNWTLNRRSKMPPGQSPLPPILKDIPRLDLNNLELEPEIENLADYLEDLAEVPQV